MPGWRKPRRDFYQDRVVKPGPSGLGYKAHKTEQTYYIRLGTLTSSGFGGKAYPVVKLGQS
jgi:hypothetical protein